jgi:hypothetical protein
MLAALVVSAGAVVGIGQVTNAFPIVESACSCPTPTFPPQNTVVPNITGNVQVGQGVLAATDGTWTHTPTSFTYNWQTSTTGAGSWSDLGDTDNLYTLINGDVGNYVRIQVTGTNSQGSAIANSNVLGPVTAAGGGGGTVPSDTLANVWVSNSGSDFGAHCVRASVAATEPTASSVCKTFDKAYQLASCGDNVLVDGSLTAAQLIPFGHIKVCANTAGCRESLTYGDSTTSTQSYASCVTIHPSSGATHVIGTIGGLGSGGGQIRIEVPYVRIIGFDTPTTTSPTLASLIRVGTNVGRTTGPCSQWDVHDVIFDDVSAGAFNAGSTSYVTFENSDFGPEYASGSSAIFINGCTVSGTSTVGNHFAMVHNTVHDYIQDVAAGSAHFEGIHAQGGTETLISRNIFKNITQQDISVQPNCGSGQSFCSEDNMLIENNVFDKACSDPSQPSFCGPVSGGGTTFICDNTTGISVQNITVRFNSYDAGLGTTPSVSTQNCPAAQTGPYTFTGNIIRACSAGAGNAAGKVSYDHNVSFSATCTGTGNTANAVVANIFTDPSFSGYDWTEKSNASLSPTVSPTIDFLAGSGVTCPATDLNGVSRPQGPGCDAGAYEQ